MISYFHYLSIFWDILSNAVEKRQPPPFSMHIRKEANSAHHLMTREHVHKTCSGYFYENHELNQNLGFITEVQFLGMHMQATNAFR